MTIKLLSILVSAFIATQVVATERVPEEASSHGSVRSNEVSEDAKKFIYLLDLKNRKLVKTNPEDALPNRVYIRWNSIEGMLVFDITYANKKFAGPDQFLLHGSIIPGEWLGMEPNSRFLFREGIKDKYDAWLKLANEPDGTPKYPEYYTANYRGEGLPRLKATNYPPHDNPLR